MGVISHIFRLKKLITMLQSWSTDWIDKNHQKQLKNSLKKELTVHTVPIQSKKLRKMLMPRKFGNFVFNRKNCRDKRHKFGTHNFIDQTLGIKSAKYKRINWSTSSTNKEFCSKNHEKVKTSLLTLEKRGCNNKIGLTNERYRKYLIMNNYPNRIETKKN